MNEEKKGLLDMTDEELRDAYRNSIEHVVFSTNDYYREIQRRTTEKHSKVNLWLTFAIAVLAFIATIATVLSVWG